MRMLDALVAERVMGWAFADETPHPEYRKLGQKTALWYRAPGGMLYCIPPDGEKKFPPIPHGDWSPSTDIAAAWMVAEKMQDDGFECKLRLFSSDKETSSATFCKDGYCNEIEHKSMAFAISIAALLAKGVTQDEIDAAIGERVNA